MNINALMQQAQKMQEQMQKQMQAMRTEGETKVAALLTPEQAATFQKMQDERKQRQEERREEMKKRLESDVL